MISRGLCFLQNLRWFDIDSVILTGIITQPTELFQNSLLKLFRLWICLGNYYFLEDWEFSVKQHCLKSVQIRSFFWSVFFCIWAVNLCIQSECRKIRTRKNSVFEHFTQCRSCIEWKTSKAITQKSLEKHSLYVLHTIPRKESKMEILCNCNMIHLFQPSLAFHIETSHLFCSPIFCLSHNIGNQWN